MNLGKLTKEQAILLHREMWNWLAENPEKSKLDWLDLMDLQNVYQNCFLCQYVRNINITDFFLQCSYCPLLWPDFNQGGNPCAGLYTMWSLLKNSAERKRLALKIANLPEKPEPEKEIHK